MSLMGKGALKSLPPTDDRPTPSAGEGVNAILDKGTTFEGKLAFEGTVHLNGNFTGEIRSKDTLVIGTTGKVQGDVDVGTLIVDGEFTGKIRTRGILILHPTAKVRGTVSTPSLQIEKGAIFEGSVQMTGLDG